MARKLKDFLAFATRKFHTEIDWVKETAVVSHEGREVVLTLRKSTRARTYRVIARYRHLEYVVPVRAKKAAAESALSRLGEWVFEHHARLSQRPELAEDTCWLLGTEFQIKPSPIRSIQFKDQTLLLPEGCDLSGTAERWLRARAKAEIAPRIDRYCQEMGVSISKLTVRDQRSKWGSCSSRGTISMNWRLVMAPPELIDYLVVHELAHRIEMNHSPKFWAIVEKHCPDYRKAEKWLKENSDRLMAWGS